jgi:hypothetical protein
MTGIPGLSFCRASPHPNRRKRNGIREDRPQTVRLPLRLAVDDLAGRVRLRSRMPALDAVLL